MNTPEQIRNNFFKDGYSISQWAKDNNFPVDLVYTDGADDTKHCRQIFLDRDAHAVITTRKHAKLWKDKKLRYLERGINY